MQLEFRSLTKNYSDVTDILNLISPVAICVEETILGPKEKQILKKYKVFRCGRHQTSRRSGGVAIVVNSGVATREIKLEIKYPAGVTVLHYKTISVCPIYLEPHLTETLHDLKAL